MLISTKLAELAGAAANGFLVGSGWFIDFDTPKNKAFVDAYRAKYKSAPDTFAATGLYIGLHLRRCGEAGRWCF